MIQGAALFLRSCKAHTASLILYWSAWACTSALSAELAQLSHSPDSQHQDAEKYFVFGSNARKDQLGFDMKLSWKFMKTRISSLIHITGFLKLFRAAHKSLPRVSEAYCKKNISSQYWVMGIWVEKCFFCLLFTFVFFYDVMFTCLMRVWESLIGGHLKQIPRFMQTIWKCLHHLDWKTFISKESVRFDKTWQMPCFFGVRGCPLSHPQNGGKNDVRFE